MTNTLAFTTEMLAPVVQRLTGNSAAQALSYEVTELKSGVGNPTSKGVYRVKGELTTKTGAAAFSVVVKQLASGLPMMDCSDVSHWNYWRREIDLFESSIVERFPSRIAYPRYLGWTDLAGDGALFWNEDLGDIPAAQWTWHQVVEAARLVAELNSIDISDAADFPFLGPGVLQGWYEMRGMFFDPIIDAVIECALSRPDTAAAYAHYGEFLPQQLKLSQIVWDARQAFMHGDFNLNNLVPLFDGGADVIALDWQQCGISAVGMEVAALFNTAYENGFSRGSLEEFNEICAAYVDAFNSFNVENPVSLNEVRKVVAALGFVIVESVGIWLANPKPENSDEENAKAIQNFVDYMSTGPAMTYATVLHELL